MSISSSHPSINVNVIRGVHFRNNAAVNNNKFDFYVIEKLEGKVRSRVWYMKSGRLAGIVAVQPTIFFAN